MAKPIFIVKTSNSPEDMELFTKSLAEQMDDYHVLVMYDPSIIENSFECLNCVGENLKDIDIKELLKISSNNSIN